MPRNMDLTRFAGNKGVLPVLRKRKIGPKAERNDTRPGAMPKSLRDRARGRRRPMLQPGRNGHR